jgi:hypothetical protein
VGGAGWFAINPSALRKKQGQLPGLLDIGMKGPFFIFHPQALMTGLPAPIRHILLYPFIISQNFQYLPWFYNAFILRAVSTMGMGQ